MNSVEKFRYAVGFAVVNFLGLGVLPNLASEYVKVYYISASVAVLLMVLFYVLLELVARKATKNARTSIAMVQQVSRRLAILAGPRNSIACGMGQ